jgi:hypothetical protein
MEHNTSTDSVNYYDTRVYNIKNKANKIRMFPKIINGYIYISSGWIKVNFIELKRRDMIRKINKMLGGK